jgi:hypothetical protein
MAVILKLTASALESSQSLTRSPFIKGIKGSWKEKARASSSGGLHLSSGGMQHNRNPRQPL